MFKQIKRRLFMKLLSPIVGSIVRHLTTAIGGYLVAIGIASHEVDQFLLASGPVLSGLLFYAIGQVWSLAEKKIR